MPGGPISYISADPENENVFPSTHITAATTGISRYQGLGVSGAIATDASWDLAFDMPPVFPSGQLTLKLGAIADGGGDAIIEPLWAGVGSGEDPGAQALSTETDQTLTLTTDDYLITKIILDAFTTLAVDDLLVMRLTARGSLAGYTLADKLTLIPTLIWE